MRCVVSQLKANAVQIPQTIALYSIESQLVFPSSLVIPPYASTSISVVLDRNERAGGDDGTERGVAIRYQGVLTLVARAFTIPVHCKAHLGSPLSFLSAPFAWFRVIRVGEIDT